LKIKYKIWIFYTVYYCRSYNNEENQRFIRVVFEKNNLSEKYECSRE
jgi:hypothetical protein